MSGLKSRRRGQRAEYMFRDWLRERGWLADRVPMSGAAQGFKGDVRFTRDNSKFYLAEIKNYTGTFKKIYDLWFELQGQGDSFYSGYIYSGNGEYICFSISTDLDAVLKTRHTYTKVEACTVYKKYSRTFNKIARMRELQKGCDVLVLKDNRMPFLFISYA